MMTEAGASAHKARWQRLPQTRDHALVGTSSAAARQALEAVAVPTRDCHRGVDRPAAGVFAAVENMESVVIDVAVAVQPAQAAVAHLCLNSGEVFPFQIQSRVEDRLPIVTGAEHTIGHQHMNMSGATAPRRLAVKASTQ
jgi:hypothetical protein